MGFAGVSPTPHGAHPSRFWKSSCILKGFGLAFLLFAETARNHSLNLVMALALTY